MQDVWRAAATLCALSRANYPRGGRIPRCGRCFGCLAPNCGQCRNCVDRVRGNVRKKACVLRACMRLRTDSRGGESALNVG